MNKIFIALSGSRVRTFIKDRDRIPGKDMKWTLYDVKTFSSSLYIFLNNYKSLILENTIFGKK